MGWVTLTLRKTELKKVHADYQLQDLQISRRKRQMARKYHAEQVSTTNSQNKEVRGYKQDYDAQRQSIYDQMQALRAQAKEKGENSSTYEDDNGNTIASLQDQLDKLKEDYTSQVDQAKTYWEDELAMIEEEANDTETQLEQEQVEIEAQMEAVSQEMQAVSDAISSEVQSSTIKLS